MYQQIIGLIAAAACTLLVLCALNIVGLFNFSLLATLIILIVIIVIIILIYIFKNHD